MWPGTEDGNILTEAGLASGSPEDRGPASETAHDLELHL